MRTRPAAAFLGALFTVAALLLAPATPAAAHNTLQAATPAPDARLTAAPTKITLRFLQRLNPEFSTIVLSDASQRKLPTGAPAVEGTQGTVTIDESLPNGTYTVAYRVVSADGHPVQGSYGFTVADPAASAAAAGAPTSTVAAASSTAAAEETDGGLPVVPLAVGAFVAVSLIGAVVLVRRRRAS